MDKKEQDTVRAAFKEGRKNWGHGPWSDEPDFLEYKDTRTGAPCMIKRHPNLGTLCGYVQVDESHPVLKSDAAQSEYSVHGGVTFAGQFKSDDRWWVGFDCGHWADLVPATHSFRKEITTQHMESYKDIDFVKNELASLALQLLLRTPELADGSA